MADIAAGGGGITLDQSLEDLNLAADERRAVLALGATTITDFDVYESFELLVEKIKSETALKKNIPARKLAKKVFQSLDRPTAPRITLLGVLRRYCGA
eukprot:CAMPEP_0198656568 /NCGR_PEP_ID=MMETSP1467-20131203/10140_1 /TAXON_ID=1462469 /ORGANISM="unid. sp., Strain CCMP2135" /LENGTH=97 /DNA_ID=CAMNT_0044392615 /DNA_START=29 /DNA_END=319 /DNA_ORIENTATION=+